MPGHDSTDGSEMADQLAKQGSECPFTGPEPACGISTGVAKKAVMDWTIRDCRKHWDSLSGLKQGKAFIQGPSAQQAWELLKRNKNQLQWVGLIIGHCHLKGRLFKLGLVNSLKCKRCLEEEKQPHISYVIVRQQLIEDFITWVINSWNQASAMTPP
jgi:hypothetical protein